MAAPKGNDFWKLRSKHGRDLIFSSPDAMWEAACEYFQWCIDNPLKEEEIVKYKDYYEKVELNKMRPFTLIGVCHYMDVNEAYFRQFEEEKHKEFSTVITRIREVIYKQKFEGAASGFLNPNIIARDLGLIDKTENKNEHSGEIKITREIKH
ncbi:MAG: DNA-packaging protein [Flavobacteriaceae bacterium]|nr:DNA-packaging protein [Flavobacteriaceae bacterium]